MKNKGFSLVELIVVIAIMAILVGVAVPVYTSYIGKAQKNKDIQMADEIKHALQIEFIAESPENFAGGVVVKLSQTGATVSGGSEADQKFVKDVLAKTFGDGWATDLALSYDGWESGTATTVVANYVGSSFSGNEKELLGQIQNLTSALSGIVSTTPTIIGSSFGSYLDTDLGVGRTDPVKVGNAAVLYVADKSSALLATPEKTNAFVDAWVSGDFGYISGEIGAASHAAAIYAQGEALFQYIAANAQSDSAKAEATEALTIWHSADFSGCTDINDEDTGVLTVVTTMMGEALGCLEDDEIIGEGGLTDRYYDDSNGESPAMADAKAYLSALSAVMDADELVLDNLGNDDCYTSDSLLASVNNYLTVGSVGIENGEMAVVINGSASGVVIAVFPTDY